MRPKIESRALVGACLRARLQAELVGQAHEGGQVELFRAQAAIDAGGLDFSGAEQGLEGVAQRFTPLIEGFAHHTLKQAMVLGWVRQHIVRR